MVGHVEVIDIARLPVQPFASVTVTVKLAVPAAVGVPVIVSPESVRPTGRAPAVTENEYAAVPPVAERV